MTTYLYSRVSTQEQDVEAQAIYLSSKYPTADYEITESFTGTTTDRPKFLKLLSDLSTGDTLIVREVSRIGRETTEVLEVAKNLKEHGIHLIIDNLGIDITTPSGEMVLTMMAGIAKMERELLLERQRIGINKAKAAGKYKGRAALNPVKISRAKLLLSEGHSKADIAKEMGIGISTLYRYLAG